MEYLCSCNNCGRLFIDTNPQFNVKQFNVDYLHLEELKSINDMRACPICETDEYLSDSIYHQLWEILSDIPINDNEEIELDFLHFEKGTNMYEIWHWFEETFEISIAEELL